MTEEQQEQIILKKRGLETMCTIMAVREILEQQIAEKRTKLVCNFSEDLAGKAALVEDFKNQIEEQQKKLINFLTIVVQGKPKYSIKFLDVGEQQDDKAAAKNAKLQIPEFYDPNTFNLFIITHPLKKISAKKDHNEQFDPNDIFPQFFRKQEGKDVYSYRHYQIFHLYDLLLNVFRFYKLMGNKVMPFISSKTYFHFELVPETDLTVQINFSEDPQQKCKYLKKIKKSDKFLQLINIVRIQQLTSTLFGIVFIDFVNYGETIDVRTIDHEKIFKKKPLKEDKPEETEDEQAESEDEAEGENEEDEDAEQENASEADEQAESDNDE